MICSFNPLLRNSLWFFSICKRWVLLGAVASSVSTLSWGILYDSSVLGDLVLELKKNGFNPLLRNSLWFKISVYSFPCGLYLVSTLSWGILYDSQKPQWSGRPNSRYSFNPLLRNSLWFVSPMYSLLRLYTIISSFNPLLRNSLWFSSIYCVRASL